MASVKKIIIRNFKGLPQISEKYIDDQFRILESAIVSILNSVKLDISLEELYRIVENLHSCNRRAMLYTNLQSLLENSLIQKLEQILAYHGEILVLVESFWREYGKQTQTIRNIFLYFDRSSKNCKYNTVQLMSINLFKTLIILNPNVKRKLTNEVMKSIEVERQCIPIDLNILRSIISMFTDLQVYDDIFQSEFLKLSETFYFDEGNILIQKYDTPQYLKHVQERILQEQERSLNYLNKYTGCAILDIVYNNLLKDHLTEILNKGFDHLIENNLNDDLVLMYNLMNKISCGIRVLTDYFVDYIMKKGTIIVTNQDNDKSMIQDLLNFKDKLDNIVENCFRSNDCFNESIRNSFVKFINNRQNKPAQLLAKYVDSKLRCKDISDEELEVVFNKVMVLFRFIQGKDVFEAFYKRDLAKRLLLGKSTSQDAEDSMIAKLKIECGSAFTSKIEGMFKDINLSQSINAAFRQHLTHSQVSGEVSSSNTDLSINVLTSSFWPNYPIYEVNLPVELVNYQLVFQKFYSANHSGRKLFWQPNLGHCVVKALFEAGNKELQVSLFQTLVLLLFNNCNKITYSEILESTNLDIPELKRTLMSLACGRSRVLIKYPKGKDVEDDDVFVFNNKFTDKLFRVRINQIQLKETAEEQKATEKSVMTDRQFQIDAAIVRIMKKKKSINHNALISELFNTLDIPVKPYDLKKRIELLIEREYMERDKDNPANYTYIA